MNNGKPQKCLEHNNNCVMGFKEIGIQLDHFSQNNTLTSLSTPK